MHISDLNILLHKYGLIMVWDPRAYHGFRPCDIMGGKIVCGASPVCSFGSFTYESLDKETADTFIQMCMRHPRYYPYEATYPYVIEPIFAEEERKQKLAASWKPTLMKIFYGES